MKKVLLDTYAWIEYLEGSKKGKKVKEILEGETDIYTALIAMSTIAIQALLTEDDKSIRKINLYRN